MQHLSSCLPCCTLQSLLIQCMTDSLRDAAGLLRRVRPSLTDDQAAFVLALRGLLAHCVLSHCLAKRHRVDYGVFRSALRGWLHLRAHLRLSDLRLLLCSQVQGSSQAPGSALQGS